MLKFIRGKGQQPSADRHRLQKDLFAYRKVQQTIFSFHSILFFLVFVADWYILWGVIYFDPGW